MLFSMFKVALVVLGLLEIQGDSIHKEKNVYVHVNKKFIFA